MYEHLYTDIPYHLIDIHDAGYEYNVYQFQNDFIRAFGDIVSRGRQPILCGGTGMYIEAVVKGYQLADAPIDPDFRQRMEAYTDEELTARLASYIKLHNHTDTESRDRLLRALEIQEYHLQHPDAYPHMPDMEQPAALWSGIPPCHPLPARRMHLRRDVRTPLHRHPPLLQTPNDMVPPHGAPRHRHPLD